MWSKFYNANAILEISDYVKRDKIDLKRDYVLMGSEIRCGKTYAFLFDAGPRAVCYNRTFCQAGRGKRIRGMTPGGNGPWQTCRKCGFVQGALRNPLPT